jgi:putative DNA primase/helicase
LPVRKVERISLGDVETVFEAKPAARKELVPGRVPVTELANAERLVARFGDDIRWASDRRVWCAWNGSHWVVDDQMGLSRRMQTIPQDIYLEASREPEQTSRTLLAKWARASEGCSVQANSIALARCHVEVPVFAKTFDRHPLLLNLKNGTMDLASGRFRDHRREDFLTKQIEVDYDPEANCPRFEKLLGETFSNSSALAGYAQRLAGYFLTGETGKL